MAKSDDNIALYALLAIGGFILYKKFTTPATAMPPPATGVLTYKAPVTTTTATPPQNNSITDGLTSLFNLFKTPTRDTGDIITADTGVDFAQDDDSDTGDLIHTIDFSNISGIDLRKKHLEEND